jgi:hypothetical protein
MERKTTSFAPWIAARWLRAWWQCRRKKFRMTAISELSVGHQLTYIQF